MRFGFIVFAIGILFCSFLPVAGPLAPEARAAAVYFADPLGNTEITVDPGDDFQIVLNVIDVTDLPGYEAMITTSGPITPIEGAAHGTWFATGHTLFGPYEGAAAPANYNTAMLMTPASISGSGGLVVFTFHADEDGFATVDIDPDYFFLADSNAAKMILTPPSTISITIGTGGMGGEGFSGGEFLLEEGLVGEDMQMDGQTSTSICMVKGDVNHDGVVNILDLIYIRARLNQDASSSRDAYRSNVHTDNSKINILDLIAVRNTLGCHMSGNPPCTPLPLVASYNTRSVSSTSTTPLDTLFIDTEADGSTEVVFAIQSWPASDQSDSNDIAFTTECSCGESHQTFSYYAAGNPDFGKAKFTFARPPSTTAPESHTITFTATAAGTPAPECTSASRAVNIVFNDIAILEAQPGNNIVYCPVGEYKEVSALIGTYVPGADTLLWSADYGVQIQSTESPNVARLSSTEAGTYAVSVAYTSVEGTYTRDFTFVAFKAMYVSAVRPDDKELFSTTVYTTRGVTQYHAEVYPEVPGTVTWQWQCSPDPGTLPFEAPVLSGQGTCRATASINVTGFVDNFAVAMTVSAAVETPNGTFTVYPEAQPSFRVPSVTVEVGRPDHWTYLSWTPDDDPRLPSSSFPNGSGDPLYIGAPNTVDFRAKVSGLSGGPAAFWQWSVAEGEFHGISFPGYTDYATCARLDLRTAGQLLLTLDMIAEGQILDTYTISAMVPGFGPLPADTFYVGKNSSFTAHTEFLTFSVDAHSMPDGYTVVDNFQDNIQINKAAESVELTLDWKYVFSVLTPPDLPNSVFSLQ